MKKYKIVILVCAFTLLGIFIGRVSKTSNVYEKNENNQMKKQVNTISMMLETEAGSGKYEMTTRDSWPTEGYVFNSTLSKCENGGELSWDDTNKKILMSGNISDKCYIYFDVELKTLIDYIRSLYTGTQGENSIYFHDSTLTNGVGDNSYRYAGSSDNVNNYICFGTNESSCPTDNLYRIIGIIDGKIKLIKANYAGSNLLGTDGTYSSGNLYQWSKLSSCSSNVAYADSQGNKLMFLSKNEIAAGLIVSGCNNWNQSSLNTINLNTNFKNSLGTFANIIEPTSFTINNNSYTSDIALISKNDYNFAFSKEYWNISSWTLSSSGDTSYKNNNWVYQEDGNCRWTIEYEEMGSTNTNQIVDLITYDGIYQSISSQQYNGGVIIAESTMTACTIYPTFFISNTVMYKNGSGTASDPIRIEI